MTIRLDSLSPSPRLPGGSGTYQRPMGNVPGDRAGSFVMEGLSQGLEAIQAAAEKTRRAQEAQWISQTSAEADLHFLERSQIWAQEAAEDGKGLTARAKSELDAFIAARLEAAPSAEARMALTERLQRLQLGTLEASMRQEHGLRVAAKTRGFETIANTRAAAVFAGGDFDQALADWSNDTRAQENLQGLPASAVAEIKAKGTAALYEARLRGLAERDPRAAQALIAQGFGAAQLDLGRLDSLNNRAQAEEKRRAAEARAEAARADALARAARAEARDQARGHWENVKAAADMGLPAQPDDIAGLRRAAAAAGEPGLAERYDQMLAQAADIGSFAALPFAEMQTALASRRGELQATGADAAAAADLKAREAVWKRHVDIVAKDPAGYVASKRGLALDANDPQALAQGIARLSALGEAEGLTLAAPLPKATVDAIIGRLAGLAAPQQAEYLAHLRGAIGAKRMAQVARQLNDKNPAYAAAAALGATDQHTAALVLEGQRLIDDRKGEVTASISAYRGVIESQIGEALADAPTFRGAVIDAALAVSAQLHAKAGKLGGGGGTDAKLLAEAVRRVAGEPLNWNGRQTLPPRPDMSADDFEDLLRAVSDEDLKAQGIRFAPNRPVTARDFRRDVTLVPVGEGKYKLALNDGRPLLNDDRRPLLFDPMAIAPPLAPAAGQVAP